MKKIILSVLCLAMLQSCTGLNTNTTINAATDAAFVLALQANPAYKPAVVLALTELKTFLSGDVTYVQLIDEISKKFNGKYAIAGTLLKAHIAADPPISTEYLTLFDAYKKGVIAKIDELILLAGA